MDGSPRHKNKFAHLFCPLLGSRNPSLPGISSSNLKFVNKLKVIAKLPNTCSYL